MTTFNNWDAANDRKASPPKVRRENCLHCSEPIRFDDTGGGCTLSSVILEGGAKQPGLAHRRCHENKT